MTRKTVIFWLVLALGTLCLLSGCESDGPTGGSGGSDFSDSLAFEIQIEKTRTSIQGRHEIVEVSLNRSPYQLSGFDLKIIFDTMGLSFQQATASGSGTDIGRELFDYEFSMMEGDNRGLVHLKGIADARYGWLPLTDSVSGSVPLFSLDFFVTDDRRFERAYLPIRFFWEDCNDNVISFRPNAGFGREVQSMTRRIIDFDLIGDIRDDSTGFPTYTGYQRECYEDDQVQGSPAVRMIDLFNGGVDIMGCDSVTELGDINLSGSSFEMSDLMLFTRYFGEGLSVLDNNDCAVTATNVNRDRLVLSSSDYVYFIRNVVGGAVPLDSLVTGNAVCTHDGGMLSVDMPVHAAQLVIVGDAQWSLRQHGLEALSHFDGFDTRVLVYSTSVWEADSESWRTFTGPFLETDATIRSIDMSTVDGARVDVTIVEE